MSGPAFRLLSIPGRVYDAVVAQALAERPNECCGLLAGVLDGGVARVVAHYPLVNALASPVEYESGAEGLFQADRDMREKGLDTVAVYHSHPVSPPVPSKKDLARNWWGECVAHLIVSLTTSPPEVRAWWLAETDYREAEWRVEG
jgi:proteasome lid subunit RPN8/RPN11